MPLITALWGFFLTILPTVVGRVLLALGLTFVAYTGIDTTITFILDNIKASFAGLPADIAEFFAWIWIDKCVTLIFSAYTAAMTFKMAGSTVLKGITWK